MLLQRLASASGELACGAKQAAVRSVHTLDSAQILRKQGDLARASPRPSSFFVFFFCFFYIYIFFSGNFILTPGKHVPPQGRAAASEELAWEAAARGPLLVAILEAYRAVSPDAWRAELA